MTERDFHEQLGKLHEERERAELQRHSALNEISNAADKIGELHEYLSDNANFMSRPDDISLYFRVANVDYLSDLIKRARTADDTIRRLDRELNPRR